MNFIKKNTNSFSDAHQHPLLRFQTIKGQPGAAIKEQPGVKPTSTKTPASAINQLISKGWKERKLSMTYEGLALDKQLLLGKLLHITRTQKTKATKGGTIDWEDVVKKKAIIVSQLCNSQHRTNKLDHLLLKNFAHAIEHDQIDVDENVKKLMIEAFQK
jgi:hypothetical protein